MSINEPELISIGLIRVALSEVSVELREKAVKNVKLDVEAMQIELLLGRQNTDRASDSTYADFLGWVGKTSPQRHEAAIELAQQAGRYDGKNERKLNVAEHIGKLILLSIQDGKFEGVQVDGGILDQVRETAKKFNVTGAKDKDTVRKIWKTYRGVVHLGMAMDYCEKVPDQDENVLHLAERFRQGLSQNCPKGTSKPYVDPDEQTSFVYLSTI